MVTDIYIYIYIYMQHNGNANIVIRYRDQWIDRFEFVNVSYGNGIGCKDGRAQPLHKLIKAGSRLKIQQV